MREIGIPWAPPGERNLATVFRTDGRTVHDFIAAVCSVPSEIEQRDEHGNEKHQMIQGVSLAHALVGPGPKRQVVPSENHVLFPLL